MEKYAATRHIAPYRAGRGVIELSKITGISHGTITRFFDGRGVSGSSVEKIFAKLQIPPGEQHLMYHKAGDPDISDTDLRELKGAVAALTEAVERNNELQERVVDLLSSITIARDIGRGMRRAANE